MIELILKKDGTTKCRNADRAIEGRKSFRGYKVIHTDPWGSQVLYLDESGMPYTDSEIRALFVRYAPRHECE